MSEMIFDKETHTYTRNGVIYTSVTQLLSKHGLSANYKDIDPTILKQAAKFGNDIHEQLEHLIKGTSKDVSQTAIDGFKLLGNITLMASEMMVWSELDTLSGTIDIMAYIDNKLTILDIKTTYAFHELSVRWQLSLYAYLYFKQYGTRIDLMKCLWYDKKNKKWFLKYLEPISDDKIQRLLECERQGVIYTEETEHELIDTYYSQQLATTVSKIKQYKEWIKELEKEQALIEDVLKNGMKEYGIKSFDNEYFKITYTPETVRKTVDYEAILNDKGVEITPQDIEKHTKKTSVKDRLTITLKEK